MSSPNKYNAQRTHAHDGRSFASKLEKALYDHLKTLEESGDIRDITCQVHVELTQAKIKYIPDFFYFDTALMQNVYAEAKGYPSERWPTIKKLWTVYGPGRLEIWGGSYKSLKLLEIIIPKGE